MRWLNLIWLLVLGGCTLVPRAPTSVSARPGVEKFALNGRISVSHDGKRFSAGIRWTHRPQSDEILLLAPLGATAARVYRDQHSATLDEGDKHYQADDAESLMQQVLGWHLPLAGMHYWVLGRASKGSPAQLEYDGEARVVLLRQNGWEVRYLRYDGNLPARLQLNQTGVQVQLLIDEWDQDPQ